MKCPKCGSSNVKVELRSAGTTSKSKYYRTGISSSWFLPSGAKKYNSERKHKTIAFCGDCGYFWDANSDNGDAEFFVFLLLLCFAFFPITLSVYFYKTEKIALSKRARTLILSVIWLFIILVIILLGSPQSQDIENENQNQNTSTSGFFSGSTSNPDSSVEQESNSIWASEYTPLDEFDYYIDDDGIHLKDCNSRSRKIWVAPVYSYEGRGLQVISIEEGHAFHSTDSIIISEGITEIDRAVFNGCGVKYLYLPSTLTEFSGWSYLHKGEKLYYGGSKEQWNELFKGERSSLDFVEIICNASLAKLLENG